MRDFIIRNLVEMIDNRELVLPAMQRPFVWDEQRMLRLMDSLLRGFPLGTLLVWATDEAQRYRPLVKDATSEEMPCDNFPQAEGGKRLLYVLDGQQRLTTLYVATKGSLDGRRMYLNVLSGAANGKDPGETYWDFRFLPGEQVTELNKPNEAGEYEQFFVSVEEFLRIEPLSAMAAAKSLSAKLLFNDSQQEKAFRTYNQAAGVFVSSMALRVHVIDEHGVAKTPVAEILEIFVRVNSGGLRLEKADLLMSLLDLSWENVQPALIRISSADVTLSSKVVRRLRSSNFM
jgi:hypothetical protein